MGSRFFAFAGVLHQQKSTLVKNTSKGENFYKLHVQGVYPVMSFMELEDIDLTGGVR